MASITVEGVPEDLIGQLRELAEKEGRSASQQAVRLIEEALRARRPRFTALHEAFVEKHGSPPLQNVDFSGLRSRETGRPSPFGSDFFDEESAPDASP